MPNFILHQSPRTDDRRLFLRHGPAAPFPPQAFAPGMGISIINNQVANLGGDAQFSIALWRKFINGAIFPVNCLMRSRALGDRHIADAPTVSALHAITARHRRRRGRCPTEGALRARVAPCNQQEQAMTSRSGAIYRGAFNWRRMSMGMRARTRCHWGHVSEASFPLPLKRTL